MAIYIDDKLLAASEILLGIQAGSLDRAPSLPQQFYNRNWGRNNTWVDCVMTEEKADCFDLHKAPRSTQKLDGLRNDRRKSGLLRSRRKRYFPPKNWVNSAMTEEKADCFDLHKPPPSTRKPGGFRNDKTGKDCFPSINSGKTICEVGRFPHKDRVDSAMTEEKADCFVAKYAPRNDVIGGRLLQLRRTLPSTQKPSGLRNDTLGRLCNDINRW